MNEESICFYIPVSENFKMRLKDIIVPACVMWDTIEKADFSLVIRGESVIS